MRSVRVFTWKGKNMNEIANPFEIIKLIWPIFGITLATVFGLIVLKEWRAGREREYHLRLNAKENGPTCAQKN
jgi:hypothetical protein